MDTASKGQVTRSAAEIYDEFFVPCLFAEWTGRVADAADLSPGQSVLDIACGTGVLAREARKRVGGNGSVIGLDCNAGMLAVARRGAGKIEWREGLAEDIGFADNSFDAVISQFGLMFFDDPVASLGEMWRVLRPGGRLVVAVWASLDQTPGYLAMTELIQRLFGALVADALRAPYVLGDRAVLKDLFDRSGISGAHITTVQGTANFPSIAEWVRMDVKGWTLANLIDDTQYRQLQIAAEQELTETVQPDGNVRFAHPAHVVTAVKV